MKRFLACLLSAVTAIMMLSFTTAFADEPVTSPSFSNSSTADLTLSNANENDQFNAYKLIDINYDDITNTISYSWAKGFDEKITKSDGTVLSVEEYMALGASGRKGILSNIHTIITENSISPVGNQSVGAVKDSTNKIVAKWENVEMGGYYIEAVSTTDVYEMIFKAVEPEVIGGEYTLDDIVFDVEPKHSSVGIIKKSIETEQIGVPYEYTIIADVPSYGLNALEKTFSVTDVIPAGVTINTSSIKVYAHESADADLPVSNWVPMTKETDYSIECSDSDEDGHYESFEVKITNDNGKGQFDKWYKYHLKQEGETGNPEVEVGGYIYDKQYKKILIQYEAELNGDAVLAEYPDSGIVKGNKNTATLTYTPFPYIRDTSTDKIQTTTKEDSSTVYTYGLLVNKVDDSNTSKMLSGAKFRIYKKLNDNEDDVDESSVVTGIYYSTEPDGEYIEFDDSTSTMDTVDGYLHIKGLKGDTTYYIKEIEAPSGYKLFTNQKYGNAAIMELETKTVSSGAQLENIKNTNTKIKDEAEKGNVYLSIGNNKGFNLPETGGVGVFMLKIFGIIVMGAAVVFVGITLIRPKKKTNK